MLSRQQEEKHTEKYFTCIATGIKNSKKNISSIHTMLQTQRAKQDTSHKFTRSSVLGATGLRWFTMLGFEAQKSYLGLRG